MTRRRVSRIILLLLIATAGIFIFRSIITSGNEPVISPIQESAKEHSFFAWFAKPKDPKELRTKVEKTIGNSWKNYSILVVDLDSDFMMGINEAEMFTAASVNKLPILAALYYKAQKKETNLDTVVTLQESDIQDYGTGSIRYDPPGTTYTVKTLARLMIQKSDNTAAYIIGNYVIGLDAVQALVSSWGLNQTNMVNNKTSNKDMALLMKKMYRDHVAGDAYTQEMFTFLKTTDFEDRMPKLLPQNATVYHKIGTGDHVVHDVGIVVSPKRTYYVGILTENIVDEAAAAGKIAEVSKVIYDYLQ